MECDHLESVDKSITLYYREKLPTCIKCNPSHDARQVLYKIAEALGLDSSLRNRIEVRDMEDNDSPLAYDSFVDNGEYNIYLLNAGYSRDDDQNLSTQHIKAIMELQNSNCRSLIADSVTHKRYKCPFESCRKTFDDRAKIRLHVKIHNGDRPYICDRDNCGKSFTTKGHLKSHQAIHEDSGNFNCNVCKKDFTRRKRFEIHMRSHNGLKPFICMIKGCKKAFTEKGNLKTHLRIHTGEKPYKCKFEDCGKSFTTQGHLTDHMRRHTGTRPFKCEFCGKAFMRSSTLKSHLRRHTGEKPYMCQYHGCVKSFKEARNLKNHHKIHIGIKTFNCEGCNLKFASKLQYEEHICQCEAFKNKPDAPMLPNIWKTATQSFTSEIPNQPTERKAEAIQNSNQSGAPIQTNNKVFFNIQNTYLAGTNIIQNFTQSSDPPTGQQQEKSHQVNQPQVIYAKVANPNAGQMNAPPFFNIFPQPVNEAHAKLLLNCFPFSFNYNLPSAAALTQQLLLAQQQQQQQQLGQPMQFLNPYLAASQLKPMNMQSMNSNSNFGSVSGEGSPPLEKKIPTSADMNEQMDKEPIMRAFQSVPAFKLDSLPGVSTTSNEANSPSKSQSQNANFANSNSSKPGILNFLSDKLGQKEN